MRLYALLGGLAAGALMGAVTRSVETSRLAFGPYALYGNGALAIPMILAPIALYVGWSWLMRRAHGLTDQLAIYVLGLILGTGLGYGAAMGAPSSMMSGILGLGLFVMPATLFAGLAVVVLRSRGLTSTGALAAAFIAGGVLAAVPPFAFAGGFGVTGISAGAMVLASERASLKAAVALGAAMALFAVVQAFAFPLLVAPFFMPR
ncbi:MAG TPA: hypothetical protein VGA16_11005 [Candidatus Limnocylindria bacterium]